MSQFEADLSDVQTASTSPPQSEPEFSPQWGENAPKGGKAVLGRILKDGAKVPLFLGQTLVKSLRDLGYNSTTSAVCEHVDNAIQWGATEGRVYFHQSPHLEAFLHVAYPESFPPGTLLGPFRNLCRQRHGMANQILDQSVTKELDDIVEYANKFHHDTNPAWETEAVNDGELRGFVDRALRFARR
jgi:hypothetical protein